MYLPPHVLGLLRTLAAPRQTATLATAALPRSARRESDTGACALASSPRRAASAPPRPRPLARARAARVPPAAARIAATVLTAAASPPPATARTPHRTRVPWPDGWS